MGFKVFVRSLRCPEVKEVAFASNRGFEGWETEVGDEERDSERENVSLDWVVGFFLSVIYFRCHIGVRTLVYRTRLLHARRERQVHQLQLLARREHEVFGFDVQMSHARSLVQVSEGKQHGFEYVEALRFLNLILLAHQLLEQRLATQKLVSDVMQLSLVLVGSDCQVRRVDLELLRLNNSRIAT